MGKQTTFHCNFRFYGCNYYDQEFGPIKFKGKKKDGAPREIYMESRDTGEIQDQAAKLLKTTIILPFEEKMVQSSRRSMEKYSHEENATAAVVEFRIQMQQVIEKNVEVQFQDICGAELI